MSPAPTPAQSGAQSGAGAPVALVTGASRGVGAAVAVALAAEGYAVACAARSTRAHPQRTPGTIDDVVERITAAGGTAVPLAVDLSDRDQVVAMVDDAVAALGRLDVLVNNAAVNFMGDLAISPRRHDLIMAIDLDAPLWASQRAAPHLAEAGPGRILNVSSAAALAPYPGNMSYGMAKAGLERLTVDLARQLAPAVAANVFRIDIAVASEGFLANAPTADHGDWLAPSVAAEGIAWMLRQPASYSGRLESMVHLAHREGIMAAVVDHGGPLPDTLPFAGLMEGRPNVYEGEA